MIQTKSVRELPAREDGLRVLILGCEGMLGTDMFSRLILPVLAFDEDASALRPSLSRWCLFMEGRIGWDSFEQLYRWEICHSDGYRDIERYARLSRKANVTFLDMCDSPAQSFRRVIAGMCGCVISNVDLRIE